MTYDPNNFELDARRYRRLRALGCALAESDHLNAGTVLRFGNLDEQIDADLKRHESRGEVEPR